MASIPNEDIHARLAAAETRIEETERRLEKLEGDHEVLARLATAVEVMATKQETLTEKIDAIGTKVGVLEAIPAGRWRALIGYVLAAAASSGVVPQRAASSERRTSPIPAAMHRSRSAASMAPNRFCVRETLIGPSSRRKRRISPKIRGTA